jgi:excisionase family DNA binding protein
LRSEFGLLMSPVFRRKAPPVREPESESVVEVHPPCRSPFASVEEAAKYLHVSQRTVRELKHLGILKIVPHYGKDPDAKPWRFLYSDLDRHIEEMKKAA